MNSNNHFIIRLNWVDLITLSGVFTASLAVIAALNQAIYLCASLLFLAMLGDALDGLLARKYQLERNFGRYLDGFMDVLIYLVAPCLALYLHGFNGWWAICLWPVLLSGCVRLAVFNDIGNIQESNGLAYLGMPVFWSVFIFGAFLWLEIFIGKTLSYSLLAFSLLLFSYAMVIRRPFFKFKKLWHILLLTLGNSLVFLAVHFWSIYHA
ncbi:MAG TPA: CDP-alcohol phosphatidyltransferase family protein [Agitococcus sp.]|nr:CDP-alcohol phosphatidyltransferase family protein [Agitococcus sp.]